MAPYVAAVFPATSVTAVPEYATVTVSRWRTVSWSVRRTVEPVTIETPLTASPLPFTTTVKSEVAGEPESASL